MSESETLSGAIVFQPGNRYELRLAIGTEPAPPFDEFGWIKRILDQADLLFDLPSGWDSYGADAIQPGVVVNAVRLLIGVMNEASPTPTLVPGSDGGVQLEWRTHGTDLEVNIPPAGPGYVYWQTEADESGRELSFDPDSPSSGVLDVLSNFLGRFGDDDSPRVTDVA